MTEEYEAELFAIVPGSPRKHGYRRPTWTQELLILVLHKRTGIRISCTTMSRLLKRLKIRLGRPKPDRRLSLEETPENEAVCEEIRQLIETLPEDEVILYVDEVDIHLNPKIGPDWMLRGTQKTVLTPGKNQKRYLAGALNASTGRLTWVEADYREQPVVHPPAVAAYRPGLPTGQTDSFDPRQLSHPQQPSDQGRLARLNGRVVLHFLPPYCPDHNRIERVWRDLHANVTRNHQCRTMKELMTEVYHWLKRRNRQHCNVSMPRRMPLESPGITKGYLGIPSPPANAPQSAPRSGCPGTHIAGPGPASFRPPVSTVASGQQ